MKKLILLSSAIITLCSCTHYPTQPYNSELMQQQAGFLQELENYTLPPASIDPQNCTTPLAKHVLDVASSVGKQQGLIVDGRKAGEGKLVLGKHIEDRQILLGIQFKFKPDGAFSYSCVTSSKLTDLKQCQKMERRYMGALNSL
jgi:hypothetical protein